MDDLKFYGKTMQELDFVEQTVRIFNSDIGMQLTDNEGMLQKD